MWALSCYIINSFISLYCYHLFYRNSVLISQVTNLKMLFEASEIINYKENTSLQRLFTLLKVSKIVGSFPLNDKFEFNKCSLVVPFIYAIILGVSLGMLKHARELRELVGLLSLILFGVSFSIGSLIINKKNMKYSIDNAELLQQKISFDPQSNSWKPNVFCLHVNVFLIVMCSIFQTLREYKFGLSHAISYFLLNNLVILQYLPVVQFISFLDLLYFFLDKFDRLKNGPDAVRFYNHFSISSSHISNAYGPAVFINLFMCFLALLRNVFIVCNFSEYPTLEITNIRILWFISVITRILDVIYFCNRLANKVRSTIIEI